VAQRATIGSTELPKNANNRPVIPSWLVTVRSVLCVDSVSSADRRLCHHCSGKSSSLRSSWVAEHARSVTKVMTSARLWYDGSPHSYSTCRTLWVSGHQRSLPRPDSLSRNCRLSSGLVTTTLAASDCRRGRQPGLRSCDHANRTSVLHPM
jgi:hypothetical protein